MLLKPLLDHDEETGHDCGSQGGRSHEPEVVRRAEPAEGSDEGGPEEDQPAVLCHVLMLHPGYVTSRV